MASQVYYNNIELTSGNSRITPEILQIISESPKFQGWVAEFAQENIVTLSSVVINDVKFFGPQKPDKVGFLMVEAKAYETATNDPIQASCAFIRGGSVGIFVHAEVVNADGDVSGNYVVLTRQIRFPMGRYLEEICAGCVDEKTNDIRGVAITELEQEMGISVNVNNLQPIGSIVPSGGGTYEEISLFYLKVTLTEAEYAEKSRNIYGEGSHEKIGLSFGSLDDIDDILDEIQDVKAECAWRRIKNLRLIHNSMR